MELSCLGGLFVNPDLLHPAMVRCEPSDHSIRLVYSTFCLFHKNRLEFWHWVTAQNGSEAVAKHMDPVSEIRQRRREEDDTETVPKRSLTKRLEKLDFYPKIGDDYVIKTESGGYGMILLRIVLMCSFRDLFHSHDHPLHFRAHLLYVGPQGGAHHNRSHPEREAADQLQCVVV